MNKNIRLRVVLSDIIATSVGGAYVALVGHNPLQDGETLADTATCLVELVAMHGASVARLYRDALPEFGGWTEYDGSPAHSVALDVMNGAQRILPAIL